MWIRENNLEGKDFKRWNYQVQPSLITSAGGRTEILCGALDPMPYYVGGRPYQPLYSTMRDPDSRQRSSISVIGAGLAKQAINADDGTAVSEDGKPVFGSWVSYVKDERDGTETHQVIDSNIQKIRTSDHHERFFSALYRSP